MELSLVSGRSPAWSHLVCLGLDRRRAGGGVYELRGETRVEGCWMGWDRTVSNDERQGTLLAHYNELFLLLSQVQHSPAHEDGIRHEVPQPSLPQVPLQVRRAKGRREGNYL